MYSFTAEIFQKYYSEMVEDFTVIEVGSRYMDVLV